MTYWSPSATASVRSRVGVRRNGPETKNFSLEEIEHQLA